MESFADEPANPGYARIVAHLEGDTLSMVVTGGESGLQGFSIHHHRAKFRETEFGAPLAYASLPEKDGAAIGTLDCHRDEEQQGTEQQCGAACYENVDQSLDQPGPANQELPRHVFSSNSANGLRPRPICHTAWRVPRLTPCGALWVRWLSRHSLLIADGCFRAGQSLAHQRSEPEPFAFIHNPPVNHDGKQGSV